MNDTAVQEGVYPVLVLRDVLVFPYVVTSVFVGREKSIRALEAAMAQQKQIMLVAQKDSLLENPYQGDLYTVGIVAKILQLVKLPDGTVKALVEGVTRAKVVEWTGRQDFFEAHITVLPEVMDDEGKIETLTRSVMHQFESYVQYNKKVGVEVVLPILQIKNPLKLSGAIMAHLGISVDQKQKILEMDKLEDRLEALFAELEKELEVLQVERKIRKRVKRQMEKTQREYYLNEQMKAIQKELGDGDEGAELLELEKKIKMAGMPKETKEKALGELKKLKMMGHMSSEAGIIRGYIDWLVSVPWKTKSPLKTDLEEARRILDEDHYGLEKVKERIIEFLAVQNRTGSLKGSILCFVGPPGVGKTSLGKSIAKATGRAFVRAALGGMRDEAEIRGHRRTYIGAMPGKIIQGMKKVKTINPLFLLDEIDKVGADYRGDPSSALLEVLDPEQNVAFNDHYLEVDYDLSHVMFITTANSYQMPRPLLDRMEVIYLSGYTEDEKVQIAMRHLIPKQLEQAGLKEEEMAISAEALTNIIRYYTRESGVRNLEREIANIARKVVKEIQTDGVKSVVITPDNLKKYMGVPKFDFGVAEKEDQVGTTTGLSYSETGGDILAIEAVVMPGKGNIILTGRLGDVMKESAEAARSFIRANHKKFGIDAALFEKSDIHIHVPEGATPKDGPSAGLAMMCSLVSALTGIPVKKTVAMTGEITLRGRALPIGGLKEKLLAALRGGIQTVLIPAENEKDLEEIPDNVKQGLHLIPVTSAEQVLELALTKPLKTNSNKG